jgi:Uma2 family endonuclease
MATTPRNVTYPESDGKPLAETGLHAEVMLDLYFRLKQHFAADPMVYVAVNLFVYYVEGDPRKNVAPDVWMARGVPAGLRRVFLVWEEPRGPEMIVEATSRKTPREDLNKKFTLYRDVLRVREYFLFDPEAEYLAPPLQGFRLI